MDILSHILWTYLPFRGKKCCDRALAFAVLPDTGYLLIVLFRSFGTIGKNYDFIPEPLMVIYHLLHSFIVVGIVALAFYLYKPKLLMPLTAWVLHIMIDIPTHSGEFGTRIFYPVLPDFYIDGISWAHPEVLMAGYLLLLLAYTLSYMKNHDRYGSHITRFVSIAGGIINNHIITVSNAASGHNQAAPGELSGEDKNSPGQGED